MTLPIPANRLVASELEGRWNKALVRLVEVESKIAAHDAAKVVTVADQTSLATLAASKSADRRRSGKAADANAAAPLTAGASAEPWLCFLKKFSVSGILDWFNRCERTLDWPMGRRIVDCHPL
jgi:hypothetical protein